MTVDLEDYYCDLNPSVWGEYESRLIPTTRALLRLFCEYRVAATFFVVGYIAERHPDLVREIMAMGHEIASHGYFHNDITRMNEDNFESDLIRSKNILSSITGEEVHGFRAPYCSINKNTLWALRIIRKHFRYDSSIVPGITPLYGIAEASTFIYKPGIINPLVESDEDGFIELPIAIHRLPAVGNIPISGGFYFRFLPYWLIKHGISDYNNHDRRAVMYIHPRDIDPEMPRLPGYGWHYYWGLKKCAAKLKNLLGDFEFGSIRQVIGNKARSGRIML